MASSRIFQQKPLSAPSAGHRFSKRKLPSATALREEVVDRQLKVIYQDRDGKVRDLTRFDRTRKFSWGTTLGVLLVLSGAVAGGWWAYQTFHEPPVRFGEEQLELSVDAPKTIAAGQKTTVTVNAVNRSGVKLNNLDALLQYPKEFEVVSANPSSEGTEGKRWKLGSLEPGASTRIALEGRFWGSVPSSAQIRASLVFAPQNLRASFRSSAVSTTAIDTSLVSVAVKSPDRLSLGQKEEWTIELKSSASENLSGFSVELTQPSQFLLEGTTPTMDSAQGVVWKGLSVASSAPTLLKFTGTFVDTSLSGTTGMTDTKEFNVRLLYGDSVNQRTLSEVTSSAVVVQSSFAVRLSVNHSLTRVDVPPGSTVTATIDVMNRGTDPVSDVELSLKLNSALQVPDLIAMDGITSKNIPAVDGTTLHWDKKSVDGFGFLRGGSSISINVTIPVRAQASGSVDLSAQAWYPLAAETKRAQSNTTTVVVSSPLSVSAIGRYYDDDNLALGTGPLPPRVGATTSVALLFTLNKKTGSYRGIDLTFAIPEGVDIVRAQAPIGLITSDRVNRTVHWVIDSVPENIPELTADVRVSVTPKLSDVGRVLPLVSSVELKAQDAKTSLTISRTIPLSVNTNLDGDSQVSGRGVVVAE